MIFVEGPDNNSGKKVSHISEFCGPFLTNNFFSTTGSLLRRLVASSSRLHRLGDEPLTSSRKKYIATKSEDMAVRLAYIVEIYKNSIEENKMKLKINQLVLATLGHVNIYHPQQFLGRIKRVYGKVCDIEDLKGNLFRIKRHNVKPDAIRLHRIS